METRLLETKITLPPRRTSEVPRPHLLQQLNLGLEQQRRLTLISAPAGYGKTTLASGWLNSLAADCPTAWYSLEDGDNDLARFLNYLTAAARKVLPGLGAESEHFLAQSDSPNLSILLNEFINDLDAAKQRLIIVLDDYHAVHAAAVHDALEHLIDHLPVNIHLVMTTRQDPPLPLARLRARGQLTEIRARDLRFSKIEAAEFFRQTMKLDLPQEACEALEQRTEGWAVGLQLAGLAMQNQADPAAFIESFRGSHRYVLDYLADEVLRQQPHAIRDFLYKTCILDRFTSESCAALTGDPQAEQILQQLETANLFLIPLDTERRWYRYHTLFSEYLRTLLPKEERKPLYQAAADWFAANRFTAEAVSYALASQDTAFAAQVIDQAINQNETWSRGNINQLSAWLDALPLEAYRGKPRLCINASRLMYVIGRLGDAEKLIAMSTDDLADWPDAAEKRELLALGKLYRGSVAALKGEIEVALTLTHQALPDIPADNHIAIARGHFSLGIAHELAGEIQTSIEHYLESSAQAEQAGVQFLTIHACCGAAQVLINTGALSRAEQTCRQAVLLARGERIPPLGLAQILLGWIALERNQLESARALLEDGIALSRRGGLQDVVLTGLTFLVRLLLALNDRETAASLIQTAYASTQAFDFSRAAQIGAAHLARFHLAIGDLAAANHWAKQASAARQNPGSELTDFTLARILTAAGNPAAVPELLQPHLDRASRKGMHKTEMEAALLLALAAQADGNSQADLTWLERSLRLAAAEGWVRLYLDEGQPLLDLLPRARSAAPELVDAILAAAMPGTAVPLPPHQQLPDPLSEQELRVLRLVIAGKSNQEIAADLFISVGTAKWHVHNILQKLGVANRPQAIARARELKLD